MLGGVAVAGAVAAGSTAFTGAGLDPSSVVAYAGGTASVTVTGATISAIKFVQSSATSLTRIDVTLTTSYFNTGKTMTLTATGGTFANVGTDKFICAYNAANGTSNTYECVPKESDGTTATTYNPTGATGVAVTLI